jgi:hypothetical protein
VESSSGSVIQLVGTLPSNRIPYLFIAVITENSVRAENAEVLIIREILVLSR